MVLLRDHGTKRLAEVLRYAIGYAEHGHPAVERIGETVEAVRELFETEWTTSAELYLPDGESPAAGRLLTNPALAATWRRLITEAEAAGAGREAQIEAARRVWREGFIAQELADAAARPAMDSSGQRHAGTLTGDDLAAFEATYEAPVSYSWNGWTVCKAGPWSQGPVLLQQLALLPDGLTADDLGTPDFLHTLIEGGKLAMADREAWYGDAADVPLAELLSRPYNDERRKLIGEAASYELRPGQPGGRTPRLSKQALAAVARAASGAAGPAAGPGGGEPTVGGPDLGPALGGPAAGGPAPGERADGEPAVGPDGVTRGDTCHLDVVDRWGNMVAATPSGGWLQSNPVIPALGFPLGTRLQMTWLDPGLPSSLTPGRRPRTTLTPSLALRGDTPVMAFGTPGGDQQDQWSTHFFLTVALRAPVRSGLDLQGAIDAPNWHQESFPGSFHPRAMTAGRVVVESRIDEPAVAELRRRGHDVVVGEPWSEGRLCAVARDPETGVLLAAANPRGAQGYAVGR
ncbi:gamma-glutamyltransferase [Streptomyces antimycoticus]